MSYSTKQILHDSELEDVYLDSLLEYLLFYNHLNYAAENIWNILKIKSSVSSKNFF